MYADALEGCLLALEDRHEEADALVRSALDRVETIDFFFARSKIRLLHAESLARAGKESDASRAASVGVEILEEKGDVAGAARARERLDELGIEVAGG